MPKDKNRKKLTIGEVIVISGKNTVKVKVESTLVSKLYGKRYKAHKNFLVDTNKFEVAIGDMVAFEQTPPISKKKSHKINKKIK